MSKRPVSQMLKRLGVRGKSGIVAALLIALSTTPVIAGAGHDHGSSEFQNNSGQTKPVELSTSMVQRLGIKLEAVSRRTLAVGIKLNGQIESQPNQTVNVTLPTGGTIKRLLVQPGDQVRAGQAVAVVTSPELNQLRTASLDRQIDAQTAIEQAEIEWRSARQNYQKQVLIAQAVINEAQKSYDVALDRAQRDRELAAQGALARRSALESEALLAQAQAQRDRAKTRISVIEAEAKVKQAKTSLVAAERRASISNQTYRVRLRQLGSSANADGTITIKATIAGTIAAQSTSQGESSEDAGKPILTIVNGKGIQVSANVFGKDLAKVRVGQLMKVKVASLPNQSFQARINRIDPVFNSDAQVVEVKASILGDTTLLKSGMFAAIELMSDQKTQHVLAIPQSAVYETPDKRQLVFVQNGQRFEPSEVELGLQSGDWITVKKGIFEGDQVVTQRVPQLYAQSLRGKPETTENDDHEATEKVRQSTEFSLGFWGWLSIPVGIVCLGGVFVAGRKLERRQWSRS